MPLLLLLVGAGLTIGAGWGLKEGIEKSIEETSKGISQLLVIVIILGGLFALGYFLFEE